MSKKVVYKQIVTSILAIGLGGAAAAAEVAGVKVEDTVRMGGRGPELQLNGAGVRTRFLFKVYVGALYLQQKKTAADAVFSDAGAKRVALHMLRDVAADQFFSALSDGLKSNHTPDQLAKFEPQLKQLEGIFKAVGAAKNGDVILIDAEADRGTRITVNGSDKGLIPGADFNRALLRIWLGEKPADADLKKAMLGG